ncbi:IQ-domain [Musa troglodytarum]|uniref:IQ-domain n=1 Tax=Musa troglodytarum TaxID=320322 RepID=A0A9E7KEH7_9LILI|nr:IQ-domain [Musa troglodytarum]
MLLTASLGADRYVASLTTISDVEVYSDLQVCYLTTIHAINSVRLMMAHRGKDVNPVKFVQASGIANQFRLKEEKKGLEGQDVDQLEPLNSSEEDGDSQKDG